VAGGRQPTTHRHLAPRVVTSLNFLNPPSQSDVPITLASSHIPHIKRHSLSQLLSLLSVRRHDRNIVEGTRQVVCHVLLEMLTEMTGKNRERPELVYGSHSCCNTVRFFTVNLRKVLRENCAASGPGGQTGGTGNCTFFILQTFSNLLLLLLLLLLLCPAGARDPSGILIVRTGSGAPLGLLLMSTMVLSWGYGGGCVQLTTHLHLVPRLKMSRAIPLLSLYAFMLCREKFTFIIIIIITYQYSGYLQLYKRTKPCPYST